MTEKQGKPLGKNKAKQGNKNKASRSRYIQILNPGVRTGQRLVTTGWEENPGRTLSVDLPALIRETIVTKINCNYTSRSTELLSSQRSKSDGRCNFEKKFTVTETVAENNQLKHKDITGILECEIEEVCRCASISQPSIFRVYILTKEQSR